LSSAPARSTDDRLCSGLEAAFHEALDTFAVGFADQWTDIGRRIVGICHAGGTRSARRASTTALRLTAVGNPHDPTTDIGPLISEAHRERVEGFVERGLQAGAKAVIGGARPGALDKGWYYEPTIMVDVNNSMEIAQEEIFGPSSWSFPTTMTNTPWRWPMTLPTACREPFGPRIMHAALRSPRRCAPEITVSIPSNGSVCTVRGWKQSGLGTELDEKGSTSSKWRNPSTCRAIEWPKLHRTGHLTQRWTSLTSIS